MIDRTPSAPQEMAQLRIRSSGEPAPGGTLPSLFFVISALAVLIALPGVTIAEHEQAPLIEREDLVYQGAFRVPAGGTRPDTFDYGGIAVTYNPVNNSLYLVGHINDQLTAEISIPPLVNSTNVDDLNTASVLQPLSDATEGKREDVNPSNSNAQNTGGNLVYNGKLYLSVYSYYDGEGSQSTSHFARPLNLADRGKVTGPVTVGTTYPGWVSGYMAMIPAVWQSDFGGPALTGNFGLPIASIQSWGPAASVFDPEDIGRSNPVPAQQLVGYSKGSGVMGSDWSTTNPYFNGTTHGDGLVFPEGTRSVLFFGNHGLGEFCYGTGDDCGDPVVSYKGVHGYPYAYQVWAYDANDLLQVKNGVLDHDAIQPYSVWNFNVPLEDDDRHRTGGVAYDSGSNLIYFVQQRGNDKAPVVHAFRVNVDPPPKAPEGLTAQ